MPAPVVEFVVEETSAGRRIYKDEAEASINAALSSLFALIAAIPSGPEGPRGPVGNTGERWIVGATREFSEGLVCVTGNAVYRRYPGSNVTALFRCLQNTTTNNANFPSSPASNAAWELVLTVSDGAQGPSGQRGEIGPRGADGTSAAVVEFPTYAAAQAHAAANPLDIVISTEGL